MVDDDSAFWDSVDNERDVRREKDNKVFTRFLLIPLVDFRIDWKEWAKGNIKTMNSRLSFILKKIEQKRLPADRTDYVYGLMDTVRTIDKKIDGVIKWLDDNIGDDSEAKHDFATSDIQTISDDVHEKVFKASSEIFIEMKILRNQIDLLLDLLRSPPPE